MLELWDETHSRMSVAEGVQERDKSTYDDFPPLQSSREHIVMGFRNIPCPVIEVNIERKRRAKDEGRVLGFENKARISVGRRRRLGARTRSPGGTGKARSAHTTANVSLPSMMMMMHQAACFHELKAIYVELSPVPTLISPISPYSETRTPR